MLTNLPDSYDFCVGNPISHTLTVGSTSNFNREKALVGAFSVITNLCLKL